MERTISPPSRFGGIKWSTPVLRRSNSAPQQGAADTAIGSRWQLKMFFSNCALHLGYPIALFGGVGGLIYLWVEC